MSLQTDSKVIFEDFAVQAIAIQPCVVLFKYWPTLLVESNGQGWMRNCPCFWTTSRVSKHVQIVVLLEY